MIQDQRLMMLIVVSISLLAGCSNAGKSDPNDGKTPPSIPPTATDPKTKAVANKSKQSGDLAAAAASLALLEQTYNFWGDTDEKPAPSDAPATDPTMPKSPQWDKAKLEEYRKWIEEAQAQTNKLQELRTPKVMPGGISYIDQKMGFGFAVNPGFGLSMPLDSEATTLDNSAKLKVYVMNSDGGEAMCMAAMFHLPDEMAREQDAYQLMEFGVNKMLKGWKLGGAPVVLKEILDWKDVEYEGSPGRELWFYLNASERDVYSRMVVYVKGTHICTLIYSDATEEALDSEACNAFFDSLVLY